MFHHDIDDAGNFYLYLTDTLYLDNKSIQDSIKVRRIEINRNSGKIEIRYVITDILSSDGVENLHFCASMARAMSRAYSEIFTLTYICGTTVGIASYLARLGRRIIQKKFQPILLTGANVLNTVLKKESYLSNLQIGGEDIMQSSGISDLVVLDDIEGIDAIVKWLFYSNAIINTSCNQRFNSLLHIGCQLKFIADEYMGNLLGGFSPNSDKKNYPCFFDKNSFQEYMKQYAPTVITARARLGGIAVGVIAVENHDLIIFEPDDPAHASSATFYNQVLLTYNLILNFSPLLSFLRLLLIKLQILLRTLG